MTPTRGSDLARKQQKLLRHLSMKCIWHLGMRQWVPKCP